MPVTARPTPAPSLLLGRQGLRPRQLSSGETVLNGRQTGPGIGRSRHPAQARPTVSAQFCEHRLCLHKADGPVSRVHVAGAILVEQHQVPRSDAAVALVAHGHDRAHQGLHARLARRVGQDDAPSRPLQRGREGGWHGDGVAGQAPWRQRPRMNRAIRGRERRTCPASARRHAHASTSMTSAGARARANIQAPRRERPGDGLLLGRSATRAAPSPLGPLPQPRTWSFSRGLMSTRSPIGAIFKMNVGTQQLQLPNAGSEAGAAGNSFPLQRCSMVGKPPALLHQLGRRRRPTGTHLCDIHACSLRGQDRPGCPDGPAGWPRVHCTQPGTGGRWVDALSIPLVCKAPIPGHTPARHPLVLTHPRPLQNPPPSPTCRAALGSERRRSPGGVRP